VLQGDLRGARLCCGLALLYVCVWRHISLIQVKAEHTAPRAFDCFVSCLLSAVHWATPSLSANLRYRAYILYFTVPDRCPPIYGDGPALGKKSLNVCHGGLTCMLGLNWRWVSLKKHISFFSEVWAWLFHPSQHIWSSSFIFIFPMVLRTQLNHSGPKRLSLTRDRCRPNLLYDGRRALVTVYEKWKCLFSLALNTHSRSLIWFVIYFLMQRHWPFPEVPVPPILDFHV